MDKKPKQQRLTGTGDAAINKLEEMAEEYLECGKRRSQLKLDILQEMRSNRKKHYEHQGLEVTVVEGAEGVRVNKKRMKEQEEEE